MFANQSTTLENNSFVRTAGRWCVIGALIGMGAGIKEGVAPTAWGTTIRGELYETTVTTTPLLAVARQLSALGHRCRADGLSATPADDNRCIPRCQL